MDDLPLQLVADHLVDLSLVSERQIQHTQGAQLARDGQQQGGLLGQPVQPPAHGLALALGQRQVTGQHRLGEHAQHPGLPEARLDQGELHRMRPEIHSHDRV